MGEEIHNWFEQRRVLLLAASQRSFEETRRFDVFLEHWRWRSAMVLRVNTVKQTHTRSRRPDKMVHADAKEEIIHQLAEKPHMKLGGKPTTPDQSDVHGASRDADEHGPVHETYPAAIAGTTVAKFCG